LLKTDNYEDHTLATFKRNTHKVVKDAIFYAQIQANNQYYKEILGQKMNKEIEIQTKPTQLLITQINKGTTHLVF
jgi:hypothetical protein